MTWVSWCAVGILIVALAVLIVDILAVVANWTLHRRMW